VLPGTREGRGPHDGAWFVPHRAVGPRPLDPAAVVVRLVWANSPSAVRGEGASASLGTRATAYSWENRMRGTPWHFMQRAALCGVASSGWSRRFGSDYSAALACRKIAPGGWKIWSSGWTRDRALIVGSWGDSRAVGRKRTLRLTRDRSGAMIVSWYALSRNGPQRGENGGGGQAKPLPWPASVLRRPPA